MKKKPLVLIILDGWGHRDSAEYNAIAAANSPVWDELWATRPRTLLSGSGMDVGLPDGQMGNSEVGHMTMGAGRVLWQSLTRIDRAIASGEFARNPAYLQAIERAVQAGKAVHIMGLLSPGGVHSHQDHIFAAIRLAHVRGARAIYLHAFLDGRDTPPRSALASLQAAQALFAELGCGRIASLSGRYYAMDRDHRWERIAPVHELLSAGAAEHGYESAATALQAAYARDESDEFVAPSRIGDAAPIADGDALLFMNFRADRARQLSRAFVDAEFAGFERRAHPRCHFVMTTEYAADIAAPVAFAADDLQNTFGAYLAALSKTQFRIAETEKYAHVTFFFSGGREEPFAGEERVLVPSPKAATYDLAPEMSAFAVAEKLCAAISGGAYDSLVCNFANGDMVGHTGVFDAAVRAVEVLDQCLGQIVRSVEQVGGQCLITADHGNLERMRDADGQPLTAHTTAPVPLVYIGDRPLRLENGGTLADVAPTMLALMGLEPPAEMSGKNLAQFAANAS